MEKQGLINNLVNRLKKIKNICAIVLGGSYATGTNRPDSDIDLGLFYKEAYPFDIAEIKKLADELNDKPEPIVSDFGEWGRWLNGGSWLIIKDQRVDFIYRNLNFVEKVVSDCLNGKIESDFYQDPPTGFHNYFYCAWLIADKVLYDPEGLIGILKNKLIVYPSKLKIAIINKFLWDSEFALSRAKKFASRNETYLTAASLTRIAHDLNQVIYALNETYFFSEKKSYQDIPRFKITPKDYLKKVEKTLGNLGQNHTQFSDSLKIFEDLIEDCKKMSKNLYTPKYTK